jgi:hypothetical protein
LSSAISTVFESSARSSMRMSLCSVAHPRGDAADQARVEPGEIAQPRERLGAARADHRPVLVAAVQRVVLGERVLDLVVARQRAALGQPELARGLLLRVRPVGDAVLGDQPRGGLREARALGAVRAEALPALGAPGFVHRGRSLGHGQNIWLRTSCAVRPG